MEKYSTEKITNYLAEVKKFGREERNPLEELFSRKETENGDVAYNTTGNDLLDLFFLSEYFQYHIKEAHIGTSPIEKLLAMFIRDPRYGLGRRDLGRALMGQAGVSLKDVVACGRWDDIFNIAGNYTVEEIANFAWNEVLRGNELAKKWMPRFNTAQDKMAKFLCHILRISEKTYRKRIKAETVEKKMSLHEDETINYEHVPSLAMVKYYKRFSEDPRFEKYIEGVKKGEKKMNFSTGTVYDIYRNRTNIDADLFFDQLPKISINCVPIVDTSGSMWDSTDSIGKAMSLGYYLARNSSFCPNLAVTFSSVPMLVDVTNDIESKLPYNDKKNEQWKRWGTPEFIDKIHESAFDRGLANLFTGDCSNTDFSAVIDLLSDLNKFPEYFVVMSDQEFDRGSSARVRDVFAMFDEKGIKTKIVWWNLNSRNATVTLGKDEPRCIFMSGYSPYLLKFLSQGFDGEALLACLLEEYAKKIKNE